MTSRRLRSRSIGDTLTHVVHTNHKNGVVTNQGPYITGRYVEDMVDYVTPDFNKKISAGSIINNNCTYSKVTRSTGSGSRRYKLGTTYDYTLSGPVTLNRAGSAEQICADVDKSIPSARMEEAIIRAYARLDPTPYAFGEDLFELRKTISWLQSPLGSLANLSKQFQRDVIARGNPVKKAKAIADVYLEYRFALSPLVRSLTEVLDYHSRTWSPRKPLRQRSRGVSEGRMTYANVQTKNAGGTYETYTRSVERQLVYRASLLYEITNPVDSLAWRLGLRVKDLPTTFWQVMPYSWMIDRFVDVSSFSRALINISDPQLRILAGSTSTRDEITYKGNLINETKSGWSITGDSGGECVETKVNYERTAAIPSLPLPPVDPGGGFVEATHLADIAALLIKRFG